MNMTNKLGLPRAIAEAMERSNENYDGHGRDGFSVSQLIGPPIITQLRKRHAAEIVEDVSEQAWRMLGTSVHYMIEKSSEATSVLFEQRLSIDAGGTMVHGKPDSICNDGYLNDYKVTSVWGLLLGDKPEWEAQLNMYDLLARMNNHQAPSGLRIIAILRDWKHSERLRDPGQYPASPIMVKPIKRWPADKQIAYLFERLELHKQAAAAESVDAIPVCSPEERWQDPAKFAVMKGQNKRASRVLDSEEAAYEWIVEQDASNAYRVEERPSVPTRCLRYCDVREFCPFGRELTPEV